MADTPERTRTLVIFAFHVFDDLVQHFLNQAIFESADVDFVVVANDPAFDPVAHGVPTHVRTIVRSNVGYDFGAWSDVLLLHGYAARDYAHYIFVNSTVKGPFPVGRRRWTDAFVAGLTDDVRLFGVTINCCLTRIDPAAEAHVQSYLFAMQRGTVLDLVEDGLFSTQYVDGRESGIREKEVRMSRLVVARGGNLGCLHSHYRGIDWRFPRGGRQPHDYPAVTFLGDIMYPQYMHAGLWTPEELVFIKGNRIAL